MEIFNKLSIDNLSKIWVLQLLKLLNLPDKLTKSVIEIAILKCTKETNGKDLPNNLLIEGIDSNTKSFKFPILCAYDKAYFSHAKHTNAVMHLLYLRFFK